MAGQTKMIIITSNEDVIRQFSLNKTTNTRIIELNNDKQITSPSKDNNNIINLAFLAELSEQNSTKDQVYKRALDLPDHNRSKAAKVSKKPIDLICTICGDRAIGFNYDVLSCASCKAFFRRNANQDLEKLKCLAGQNQCSLGSGVRRKCQRCRLDKCLGMGMRKDFILSEEEKQRRKKRLEENRNNTSKRLSISDSATSSSSSGVLSNSESFSQTFDDIDRLMMEMEKDNNGICLHESPDANETEDIALEVLSSEDWMVIQSIRSSFLSIIQNSSTCYSSDGLSDRNSALICWSHFANQLVLRFINFFRQIDEFEGLHADDRFTLIKYNVFPVFPISKCFNHKPTDDCFASDESEEAVRHRRFMKLCFDSVGVRDKFFGLVISLIELTEQDPVVLSLLLTILIFSQGLSMNEDEPSLKDPLAVYRAQSYYTKLLWNYLVNKLGESQTCRYFTKLLNIIFRLQLITKGFREFFRAQFTSSNIVDQIAPLIQTVLDIS